MIPHHKTHKREVRAQDVESKVLIPPRCKPLVCYAAPGVAKCECRAKKHSHNTTPFMPCSHLYTTLLLPPHCSSPPLPKSAALTFWSTNLSLCVCALRCAVIWKTDNLDSHKRLDDLQLPTHSQQTTTPKIQKGSTVQPRYCRKAT